MTLRNYSSTAAQTTLNGGVDASVTTLVVSATTGFPATPFVLAIDAGAAAQELVLVTNVAGTTLTVTRAYDSTVASAHDTGAAVIHSHAALDFREANAHVNATTGVHGATGALMGATDVTNALNTRATAVEVLTNKDLTGATNSFPASNPRGVLGYAQATANQGGVTSPPVDLTGLSVAATVGTARRIRITGSVAANNATAGVNMILYINEGATRLQKRITIESAAGNEEGIHAEVILTPTAGAHTYKLQLEMGGAGGNLIASATQPAFILVEDIGAA